MERAPFKLKTMRRGHLRYAYGSADMVRELVGLICPVVRGER